MGHASRSVGHGCPDVFFGQVRIVFEQIPLGATLGEFAQDQFDRDSRPRITGLPIMTAGSMAMRSVVIENLFLILSPCFKPSKGMLAGKSLLGE